MMMSVLLTARWIECEDEKMLSQFKQEQERHLALDGAGSLTYLSSISSWYGNYHGTVAKDFFSGHAGDLNSRL